MNKQKHCKCEQLLSKKISDEQWRTSWGGTPSVIVRKSTFWYDSIHGRTKKMPRKKGGFGMIGRWSDDEADRSASSMMACSNNGSGQQIQVKRVNARVNLVNVFVKHLLQGAEPYLSPSTVVKGGQLRFRALYIYFFGYWDLLSGYHVFIKIETSPNRL